MFLGLHCYWNIGGFDGSPHRTNVTEPPIEEMVLRRNDLIRKIARERNSIGARRFYSNNLSSTRFDFRNIIALSVSADCCDSGSHRLVSRRLIASADCALCHPASCMVENCGEGLLFQLFQ